MIRMTVTISSLPGTAARVGKTRWSRIVPLAGVLGLLCTVHPSPAATVRVPGDQPSIQAGVTAASWGDTVLVAPGTYTGPSNREIEFHGVGLVLRSEKGAEQTIIDCQHIGTGFWFVHGETEESIVEGFTIRRGGWWDGGGMNIELSSPTIKQCVFLNCFAEGAGAGFIAHGGAPRFIECDFIRGDTFGGGGGACWGSSPSFYRCTFVDNLAQDGAAFFGEGGSAVFEYCTFIFNHSWEGEVISWGSEDPLRIVGCTIVDSECHAIYLGGGTAELSQTIIAFGDEPPIVCEQSTTIELACCDIYGNTGGDWIGCIASQYGIDGNISQDPLFCDALTGDFTLDSASPCAPEHSGGCGLIGAWPVECGSTGLAPTEAPPLGPPLVILRNPVVGGAEFVLDLAIRPAALEIYDPQGRCVERFTPASLIRWVPSSTTASGVYFAALRGTEQSAVVKFVLVR